MHSSTDADRNPGETLGNRIPSRQISCFEGCLSEGALCAGLANRALGLILRQAKPLSKHFVGPLFLAITLGSLRVPAEFLQMAEPILNFLPIVDELVDPGE